MRYPVSSELITARLGSGSLSDHFQNFRRCFPQYQPESHRELRDIGCSHISTMIGTPGKSACLRWCRLRQTTELHKRVAGRIWLFEPHGLPCETHVLKNRLLLQTHTHTHIRTTKALLAQAGGPVLPSPKRRFGLHTAASRVEIH